VHDDNSSTARYDRPYRAVLQTNEKKQKHRHIRHSFKETQAHTGTSVRNGRVWPCFFFKSSTRHFRDQPHAGGSNAVLLTEAWSSRTPPATPHSWAHSCASQPRDCYATLPPAPHGVRPKPSPSFAA